MTSGVPSSAIALVDGSGIGRDGAGEAVASPAPARRLVRRHDGDEVSGR